MIRGLYETSGRLKPTLPLLLLLMGILPGVAGERLTRYAIVLSDPPVAAGTHRRSLETAHQNLRSNLERRKIRVTGSVRTLANAIFVETSRENIATLRAMPGVKYVQEMMRIQRKMDRALPLVNAPAAWTALGGVSSAGTGMRIAIIDSGIDQNNPSFMDASLTTPVGFPICIGDDCNYATNKIIAVRSYVNKLVFAYTDDTRPDDLTPRDRVGHGTAAAMVAAGVPLAANGATISGVAPKAFLGNYKIYGSPGVNDYTYDDIVVQALEDSFNDGFHVALLASARPASWSAADSGSICGNKDGVPCDLLTDAVATATLRGMAVVVSAGSDGNSGAQSPTLNTINTPASAPSAIAVGATTNSRRFFASVSAQAAAPATAQNLAALMGRDGPRLAGPLTAPMRDVMASQDDGRACSALPAGSLSGAIALILRGNCSYETKINNAQNAGAVAVVVYNVDGDDSVVPPFSVQQTAIPMAFIGNTPGRNLKTYLASAPGAAVTIDPKLLPTDVVADEIAHFSSEGPNIGDYSIKPDLVAVGTDIWVATQSLDPNGDMYDASGFTSTQGTSFAAAMVAGAAALVKQNTSTLTPAQIKSALVNTASGAITDYDYNNQPIAARAVGAGGGKLNVAEALKAKVMFDPPSVSFGSLSKLPVSKTVTVFNSSAASVNLTFGITQRDTDAAARVTVSPAALTVAAGRSGTITLQLSGSNPAAGMYEGVVTVQGAANAMHIPYLYIVSDFHSFNAFAIMGDGFTGVPGGKPNLPYLLMKIVDAYGAPVANVPVLFKSTSGGGIDSATATTDDLGIAQAVGKLGSKIGEQSFTGEGDGILVQFNGKVIAPPTIRDNGVVNAASGTVGGGLAPGSYVSIFGSGLSDVLRVANTASLPLSLASVNVGFDVPGKAESYAGRIHFVSPGQVNVQVPWELQGKTSATMKVSIGDFSTANFTVQLNDYSPAFFEYAEQASGKSLIAALDENFKLLTSTNGAKRGRPIQIYANGLGPVDVAQATGEPAPSAEPFARTKSTPVVTIGGVQAQVLFSGLAPSFVGLYQMNVLVPDNASLGMQSISVTVNGVASKASNVMVQ
jgi:minor extracellular serine protease Vpr